MRQELVEAAMAMGGWGIALSLSYSYFLLIFLCGVTGDTYAHIKLQLDHYGVP